MFILKTFYSTRKKKEKKKEKKKDVHNHIFFYSCILDLMNGYLHDQRRQYQHCNHTEVLPSPASCIQIPDSVMNSYYTKVGAMQLPAKGSHCGRLDPNLS